MKIATIYFGSLENSFALAQDWSEFNLGIFAADNLEGLRITKAKGLWVFSYTHQKDEKQNNKLISAANNGLFLDHATAPVEYIDDLVEKLDQRAKKLIVNTGWGMHDKLDYGKADMLLIESFLGTNSGDDGKWPVSYSRTNERTDLKKLETLKRIGYDVIVLSYGPAADRKFAEYCFRAAKINGADYFIYAQAPGWEKSGSEFRLFRK